VKEKVPIPTTPTAWIDKSALKLKNNFQNIQSSPDLSGELFVLVIFKAILLIYKK